VEYKPIIDELTHYAVNFYKNEKIQNKEDNKNNYFISSKQYKILLNFGAQFNIDDREYWTLV
jgi:hypothetical protein